MISKILIPTDFSIESEYALKLANLVSMQSGAEVCLLHVDLIDGQIDQSDLTTLRAGALERLDNIATDVKYDNIKMYVKEQFIYNDESITDAIERIAVHDDFDLIISATKHLKIDFNPVKKSLVGSLNQKITVPIIFTGKLSDAYSINKVLYVSNFIDQTLKTELLVDLGKFESVNMTLLNLSNSSENDSDKAANLQLMNKFESKYGLTISDKKVIQSDSASLGIINFQESIPHDLIAIDYNIISDIKFDEIANTICHIIDESNCPILILK